MGKLIVVVGGSTSGKTKFAFDMATSNAGMVICGDQYQTLQGWPISSGASDALAYHYIWKELYLSRPGNDCPYDCDEYLAALRNVLAQVSDDTDAIIDGMSVEYMKQFAGYERFNSRDVSIIGINNPPRDIVKERILKRAERMVVGGVIPEVVLALDRYGRDCWLVKNSLVVQHVMRLFEGKLSDVSMAGMLERSVQLATDDKRSALQQFDSIKW